MAAQSEGNKISFISFISVENKNYPHEVIIVPLFTPEGAINKL